MKWNRCLQLHDSRSQLCILRTIYIGFSAKRRGTLNVFLIAFFPINIGNIFQISRGLECCMSFKNREH